MAVMIHSTGPAAVFISGTIRNDAPVGNVQPGTVTITPPQLFGWCERSPEIVIEHQVTPLYNTLGGVELPYMYYPQGSEAVITCTFTRWNDYLATVIENLLRGTTVLEQSFPVHRGALAIAMYYTMAAVGDPAHRTVDVFPFVRVVGITRHELGTMGEKLTVVFAAQRVHIHIRPYFGLDFGEGGVPAILDPKLASPTLGFGEMSLGGCGGLGDMVGRNLTLGMFLTLPLTFEGL
jgi:hypothetical protein